MTKLLSFWKFNSDFGKLNWITVYAIQSVSQLAKKTWTFNLFQFLHLNFTIFDFLRTLQPAKLLASLHLVCMQLGQKVLTLNLIHSEELFHYKSFWTFIYLVSFISLFHCTEQLTSLYFTIIVHRASSSLSIYLLLEMIAISELWNCSEHWQEYRKPTTLPAPRRGYSVTCSIYITVFLNLNRY